MSREKFNENFIICGIIHLILNLYVSQFELYPERK